MIRFRYLLVACSVFSALGLANPKKSEPILRSLCQQILADFLFPVADPIGEMERTTFQIIPFFQAEHPNAEAFRSLATEFVKRRLRAGEAPLFIQASLSWIAQATYFLEITPPRFQAALARAEQESEPLFRYRDQPRQAMSLSAFNIHSANPLLQQTLQAFQKSGVKIYATAPVTLLEMHLPFYQRLLSNHDYCQKVFPGMECETMGTISSHFHQSLTSQGTFDPMGKRVLLPSYFPLPNPAEVLIGQMAYVAQDFSWDMAHLLEIFVQKIRPLLKAGPGANPDIIWNLLLQSYRFKQSLRPDYRRAIFARGTQSLDFKPLEWLYFFDWVTLLTEVDAHYQATVLALERGRRPGEAFESYGNIFQYVVESSRADGRLSGVFPFHPGNLPFFLETIDWLNENRVVSLP